MSCESVSVKGDEPTRVASPSENDSIPESSHTRDAHNDIDDDSRRSNSETEDECDTNAETQSLEGKVDTNEKFDIPDRFTKNGRRRAVSFPLKLMKALSLKKNEGIIIWLPGGESFKILRPRAFKEEILPSFFKEAKYSSFKRKLHRWGFQRHCAPDEDDGWLGAETFSHEHFKKNDLALVEKMTCQKAVAAPKKTKLTPNYVLPGPAGSNMRANFFPNQISGMVPMFQMPQMQQMASLSQNESSVLPPGLEAEVTRRLQSRTEVLQRGGLLPQESSNAPMHPPENINAAIEEEVARRLQDPKFNQSERMGIEGDVNRLMQQNKFRDHLRARAGSKDFSTSPPLRPSAGMYMGATIDSEVERRLQDAMFAFGPTDDTMQRSKMNVGIEAEVNRQLQVNRSALSRATGTHIPILPQEGSNRTMASSDAIQAAIEAEVDRRIQMPGLLQNDTTMMRLGLDAGAKRHMQGSMEGLGRVGRPQEFLRLPLDPHNSSIESASMSRMGVEAEVERRLKERSRALGLPQQISAPPAMRSDEISNNSVNSIEAEVERRLKDRSRALGLPEQMSAPPSMRSDEIPNNKTSMEAVLGNQVMEASATRRSQLHQLMLQQNLQKQQTQIAHGKHGRPQQHQRMTTEQLLDHEYERLGMHPKAHHGVGPHLHNMSSSGMSGLQHTSLKRQQLSSEIMMLKQQHERLYAQREAIRPQKNGSGASISAQLQAQEKYQQHSLAEEMAHLKQQRNQQQYERVSAQQTGQHAQMPRAIPTLNNTSQGMSSPDFKGSANLYEAELRLKEEYERLGIPQGTQPMQTVPKTNRDHAKSA